MLHDLARVFSSRGNRVYGGRDHVEFCMPFNAGRPIEVSHFCFALVLRGVMLFLCATLVWAARPEFWFLWIFLVTGRVTVPSRAKNRRRRFGLFDLFLFMEGSSGRG